MHSDLIIIGAGPGGYETALAAAEKGKNVTLINGDRLGGTCLNEGCIPTKCMVKDAEVIHTLRNAADFSACNVTFDVDFNKVISRKNAVVDQLRAGIDMLLSKAGVTVVHGIGRFKDEFTVCVGDEEYDAEHIIIATGSSSKALPIPGGDAPFVLDSTSILNIEYVPAHLVIIGGGVIGLEFASIFNAFGSDVTVVEFMKNIAPNFDTDISKRLKQSLVKRGIKIITGASVTEISQNEDYESVVSFEQKGKTDMLRATDVLMAVGRKPNVDNLNLEAAGVIYSEKGIQVDDNMRTNVKHIFAIGDVNAKMMLAHVASYQGKCALNAIEGRSDNINFNVVPSALFTDPECAMVGLTEEQCKNQGIEVRIGKSFYRANGKALAGGESDGICKLLFNADTDVLIGAHIMGAQAAILAQQCCDFISAEMTASQIKDIIFGHPTLSEIIAAAL